MHERDASGCMEDHQEFGSAHHWRCPTCVAREFKEKRKLLTHINKYHVKGGRGVLSTKLQYSACDQWNQTALSARFNELRGRNGNLTAGNLVNSYAVGIRVQ
eukprot:7456369-Pyramimonas_sp.AAC.1